MKSLRPRNRIAIHFQRLSIRDHDPEEDDGESPDSAGIVGASMLERGEFDWVEAQRKSARRIVYSTCLPTCSFHPENECSPAASRREHETTLLKTKQKRRRSLFQTYAKTWNGWYRIRLSCSGDGHRFWIGNPLANENRS